DFHVTGVHTCALPISSIVYDNVFFLKFYRKVDRGINPDVEVSRFFSKHRKFTHVPAFHGTVEWKHEQSSVILAMVQQFIENNGEDRKRSCRERREVCV